MSLHNYLVRSREACEEIRWGFSLEEKRQLYWILKEIGGAKYFSFVKAHRADILKYISLPDSRRQQKKWVNHPDILLIRVAALQISDSTVKLCENIEPIAHLVDGGSYREFHAAMAEGIVPLLLDSFPLYDFFDWFEIHPFKS